MKKNKVFPIITVITLFVIITTGAICNRCELARGTEPSSDNDKKEFLEDKSPDGVNTPATVETEYSTAFGIDYSHPERYLSQGEQCQISDKKFLDDFQTDTKGIEQLGSVYRWLKDEFDSYSAGGKTIGKVTVDGLLEQKVMSGCDDYALVFCAVARELGYPSTLVRSSSIVWIKDFKVRGDDARPRIGHIFVEVYLDNKWILIDPTNGWYLDEDYDPSDAVIPLKGNIAGQTEETYGFYVERKGIDIWDMGIYGQDDSAESMDEIARKIDPGTLVYPDYDFKRFF